MSEGVVSLQRVAQDGMRARANAGKGSFRRRPRLEHYLAEAESQVTRLKQRTAQGEEAADRRPEAARQRASAERQARVAAALKQCEEIQRQRQASGRKDRQQPARASTTDPEARVMKFGNVPELGGWSKGLRAVRLWGSSQPKPNHCSTHATACRRRTLGRNLQ